MQLVAYVGLIENSGKDECAVQKGAQYYTLAHRFKKQAQHRPFGRKLLGIARISDEFD